MPIPVPPLLEGTSDQVGTACALLWQKAPEGIVERGLSRGRGTAGMGYHHLLRENT